MTVLEKLLHPICARNIDVPNLLKDIAAKLIRKSECFFVISHSERITSALTLGNLLVHLQDL